MSIYILASKPVIITEQIFLKFNLIIRVKYEWVALITFLYYKLHMTLL